MCVGDGRVVVMVVCIGGSVALLMRFVWRSLGCGDGCVGVGVGGCLGVWVGGWVSEFWTSGLVYMIIFTISMSAVCITQFGQKVD